MQSADRLRQSVGALPDEEVEQRTTHLPRSRGRRLTEEGKVISVRLALFAEMVKGKPWTPAALKAVGGAEGVGVAFLDETFTASTAPRNIGCIKRRRKRCCAALLPEAGTDIKGNMRSRKELMDASGYGNRPKDFDELLRILDSEIRLITPTDPEGKDADLASFSPSPAGVPGRGESEYYQLTHDYLVPSLRIPVTRKTKRDAPTAGRNCYWRIGRPCGMRPENRQLPSLWQWGRLRWLTTNKNWSPQQRKMMPSRPLPCDAWTNRLFVPGLARLGRLRSSWPAKGAKSCGSGSSMRIWWKCRPSSRTWQVIAAGLTRCCATPMRRPRPPRTLTNNCASLALLPDDAGQVDYLYGRLLNAGPYEVQVIRDALAPHKDQLLDRLWTVAATQEKGQVHNGCAAAALAKYDPEGKQWSQTGALVVNDLVQVNPIFLGQWSEAFRPVKDRLLPRLSVIFRDQGPEHAAERSLATNLLADYASDDPQLLADLLMDADAKQFAVIYPSSKARRKRFAPI